MRAIRTVIENIADTDATVLICGVLPENSSVAIVLRLARLIRY